MDRSNPEAHLYVLPWIQQKETIAFGSVQVSPAAQCLDDADPSTDAARKVLACYRGLSDVPVSASLMWVPPRCALDLEEADLDSLVLHRMCLSAGLIMSNDYYNNAGFVSTNDSHCMGYFHRFRADAEHVSIYKRRREGRNLDGWPLSKLSMKVPLAASPAHLLVADQSLLDALVATVSSGSDLGRTLERALPPFLQGNHLSEQTTPLDDLVWMGAAFERLLGVANDVGRTLSVQVAELFSGASEVATEWEHISRNGNPQPESGPWRQRWMREFYDRRSVVHSGEGAPGTWDDTVHCVIAAEVFSLAVMMLLDVEGIRSLKREDRARIDALDRRIEALAVVEAGVVGAWSQPLAEARERVRVADIAAALTATEI